MVFFQEQNILTLITKHNFSIKKEELFFFFKENKYPVPHTGSLNDCIFYLRNIFAYVRNI